VGTKEPKAISLFSGAGGMDVGIRKAGFPVLAELEMDKHCCQTLRAATQREGTDTVVYECDVREMDPMGVCAQVGMAPLELDLLFGGPPCQPFSQAGKQGGLNDSRGSLLFEMVRFAECMRPKVVLIEQVKGLLSAKGESGERRGVLDLFLGELEKIGYAPKWQVCRAADFGVAQLRERVFIVATRGQNGFAFPERTYAPRCECPGLFGSKPYVTVGEALLGLGRPSPKAPGTTFQGREDSHVDVTPARDRERIARVPQGSYLAAQTHLGKDVRGNLTPKDTTKYLRLDSDKPSNTLRCGEIFFHPTEDRYLTPREYMRLHGYDDGYRLLGPIRSRTGRVKDLDQHRQVANSVPPPLARAIGDSVRGYLADSGLGAGR
jgi:DNA (cytosine-5)-methyltransferase 1